MRVHRGPRFSQQLFVIRRTSHLPTVPLTTPFQKAVGSQLIITRRASTTQPILPTADSSTSDSSSPPKPRQIPYKALVYGTIAVLIGLTAGNTVRSYLAPPPLPTPNTAEDLVVSEKLRKAAIALPIVKELRLHPDEWVEISAYSHIPDIEKAASFTAGSMSGSRGLAVNTVFWNRKEKRTISVIHFGGALTGWPGVTHGGAIATVMLESLERLASAPNFDPDSAGPSHGFVEKMELQYRAPTFAKSFYVIRTEVDEFGISAAENTSVALKARLESADKGTLCVEATAQCRPHNQTIAQLGQTSGQTELGELLQNCYKAVQNLFA